MCKLLNCRKIEQYYSLHRNSKTWFVVVYQSSNNNAFRGYCGTSNAAFMVLHAYCNIGFVHQLCGRNVSINIYTCPTRKLFIFPALCLWGSQYCRVLRVFLKFFFHIRYVQRYTCLTKFLIFYAVFLFTVFLFGRNFTRSKQYKIISVCTLRFTRVTKTRIKQNVVNLLIIVTLNRKKKNVP